MAAAFVNIEQPAHNIEKKKVNGIKVWLLLILNSLLSLIVTNTNEKGTAKKIKTFIIKRRKKESHAFN